MTKFKGPVFKSFIEQKWPPKQRFHFKYHQGRRERIRNLKKQCRKFLDSKDPAILAQGYRIMQHCKNHNDPGYAALMIMVAAVDLSKKIMDTTPIEQQSPVSGESLSTGWTPDTAWVKAVDMLFEEIAKIRETVTAATEGGNQNLDNLDNATEETR